MKMSKTKTKLLTKLQTYKRVAKVIEEKRLPLLLEDDIFHFTAMGYIHGYPNCCIAAFNAQVMMGMAGAEVNIPGNFSGFIPCPKHKRAIKAGKIKLEDLIDYDRRLSTLGKFNPKP
jgi:hypothetical protein